MVSYLYGKILHHHYPNASGVQIPHEHPYTHNWEKLLPVHLSFNCDSSTNLVSLLGVHAQEGYSS